MNVTMNSTEPRGVGAPLWTPWGIQRRPDRDAQMLAIRALVNRVAELHNRNEIKLADQQADLHDAQADRLVNRRNNS
ncbi:MAG: hypothetical protein H0T56_08045 [Pseudaminobacter sp.]|nr:hypothetical protein [Pseudaminobacter sp.]